MSDDEDDEDLPWFVRPVEPEEDDAAKPTSRSTSEAGTLEGWRAAEAANASALARAAAALARLDERGRMGAPIGRLTARFAAELMRRDGRMIRAETLAAHALGAAPEAASVTGDERYRAGRWIMRRLERRATFEGTPDIRSWLGWTASARTPEAALRAAIPRAAGADERIARWLALREELSPLHPLTRAAALGREWAREGPASPDQALIAALVAAKAGGETVGAAGAPFTPAAFRFPLRPRAAARDLADWLAAAEDGALAALRELTRIAEWRGWALAAVSGAPRAALVEAFAAHHALSVEMAAREIGKSNRRARELIGEAEAAGLAREITGGASFRFWTARL
ncbi:MAG: hypothetical protein AAFN79_12245 [Pseudomonadota bacterium]